MTKDRKLTPRGNYIFDYDGIEAAGYFMRSEAAIKLTVFDEYEGSNCTHNNWSTGRDCEDAWKEIEYMRTCGEI